MRRVFNESLLLGNALNFAFCSYGLWNNENQNFNFTKIYKCHEPASHLYHYFYTSLAVLLPLAFGKRAALFLPAPCAFKKSFPSPITAITIKPLLFLGGGVVLCFASEAIQLLKQNCYQKQKFLLVIFSQFKDKLFFELFTDFQRRVNVLSPHIFKKTSIFTCCIFYCNFFCSNTLSSH